MTGHEDRLAGLVVLSAVLGGVPRVVVRGIPATRLARGVGSGVELAGGPGTAGGAGPTRHVEGAVGAETAEGAAAPIAGAVVVGPDATTAAARLDALHGATSGDGPGLVWVLWNGRDRTVVHRAAARAGLEAVATYRSVGASDSPTHLVREGPGSALQWFAASARPRWGPRSRLARLGNTLPRVGHRFFDGTAVLFVAAGGAAPRWPGSEFSAEGATRPPCAPAVLHLGGGATAGRLVLTWADGVGAPTHHTKLAPEHLTRAVVAEAEALTTLGGITAATGSVPTLLGLRRGATWTALTASHLPGEPPGAGRTTPALAILRATATWPVEVDAAVTAWVSMLSQASREQVQPVARAGARTAPHRLALAVAALDDADLRSVVRRGLVLGATPQGLLHGDLWPGNVHVAREPEGLVRVAVLDWESALVGHPLVDLLTWLVNSAGHGGQVRRGALLALRGGGSDHHRHATAHHVRTLLATVGQPLEPAEIEALVLAQMVVIAVEGGPAGGHGVHERAWLHAVRDVWAAWQRTGSSPWSPRRRDPR